MKEKLTKIKKSIKKLKQIIPNKPKNPIIEKKNTVKVKGLSFEHNRHVVTLPIAKKIPPIIGRKLKYENCSLRGSNITQTPILPISTAEILLTPISSL